MKIVLAGGGTGGHLFPGLALAEEARRRSAEARILLLCTDRDEAYEGTRSAGLECQVIPSIHTGSLVRRLAALVPAFVRAMRGIGRFGPDVVVGLGGYGSVAPVLCAALRRIPSVLLEQNVVPGRSNRFLARFVNEVDTQWAQSVPRFRTGAQVRVTGNPVRTFIQRRERAACAAQLGLDPSLPTLLVMGGSQGARPLNDFTISALPLLANSGLRMQAIHLAGAADCDRVRASYEHYAVPAKVFGFLEDMPLAYSACDLAFSRAGGTSIAELTALGIPAILVPYPHAMDNHQFHNARVLEQCGAALLLEQATLSPHRLAHHLTALLGDRERLEAMGRQSRAMGVPRAAAIIADRLEAVAAERNGRHGRRLWRWLERRGKAKTV
ncbi:MAG TPA: undecaprenyldiphospho-muramoylpentapeptide beta-N-acetylglucosaminyltransferase [Planctomycetota bacterium]|nr:undecaprenyldiphospho-muramoylpentapeptide beta-N-acetylglucosaminyltransferase [Planctomycetota bacterium]HRR81916.1 undecaprenyldiphospho-muramoylpentapeptide beta-N-acetylglucosaminyltransferase [Planctomycetota bacterium]HRT94315.1 undecaprenyldiphospho-muramoylpentapeptide beta-N-acetylglucosaminyltransferase [Planctomycetota bacterium]